MLILPVVEQILSSARPGRRSISDHAQTTSKHKVDYIQNAFFSTNFTRSHDSTPFIVALPIH